MVQWKGNTDQKQVGQKAANLDSLNRLEVPNFFVLTKQEIGKYLDSTEPRKILNTQLPNELKDRLHDAYDDIGMSSEVRNASGHARDLVGGQRENQRVSIRISSESHNSEYKLNIGSSNLENALKQVLASHYRNKDSTPAVIIQKMIEPDLSGAVINNYTRRHSLVEAVEGLGHSIEEGLTVPEFYLLENNSVTETRIPQKQVKVTRNPMNGQRRTRTSTKNNQSFQNSEINKITKKASQEELSLKFAYKRGTFYIVDAFKNQPLNSKPDLEALKVSNGEITGRQGEDYILTEEPKETNKPQVSKKGGYTSKPAYKARQTQTPAVFSLKSTDKINQQQNQQRPENRTQNTQNFETKNTNEQGLLGVTATEIRPINDFPQLAQNPFNLDDSEVEFADNCEKILSENPELIDGRNIEPKALLKAIETVDQIRVLVTEEPSDKLLEKLVEKNIEILATSQQNIESVKTRLLRKEKQFILDNLRN